MKRPQIWAVVALLGLALGCAEERPAINRVQANALRKAFFIGERVIDPETGKPAVDPKTGQAVFERPEFYMMSTIVDVPYGAGQDSLFTQTWAQVMTRIRWDIQEHYLVARLSYERVANSDHTGVSKIDNDGQIIAMFRIDSQFDIKRAYNPVTGEPTNIIEENQTDRVWWEREYFRVDWSENLVTDSYDFDMLSLIGLFGTTYEPVRYYIEDPTHPDAPVFDEEGGYFDITQKVLATPGTIEGMWGFDKLPSCWLPSEYGGNWPIGNCNPVELTIRSSFMKVGDRDYEPAEWTADKYGMFGSFVTERYGYDRYYGQLDEKWHRFAVKFNVWARSHIPDTVCNTPDTGAPGMDPHRDLDHDGTEDECFGVGDVTMGGARCDAFSHQCSYPLRERGVRTIPFYYGPESPVEWSAEKTEAVTEATKRVVEGWNRAVRTAIQAAYLTECRRTGGSDCDGQFPTDDIDNVPRDALPDVFLFCHNPVRDTDDLEVCGPVGLAPRLGDIRYNFLNQIPTPQSPSAWAIAMGGEDPVTGERIQQSISHWTHVLDLASASTLDIVRWLDGELKTEDLVEGKNVEAWRNYNERNVAGKVLSQAQVQGRFAAIDTELNRRFAGLTAEEKQLPPEIREVVALRRIAKNGGIGPGNAELQARLDSLKGTKFEKMMITPDVLQLAGFHPTQTQLDDQVIQRASPLRGQNAVMREQLRRARELALAKRGACIIEAPVTEPVAYYGLAKKMRQLFPQIDPNDPDYATKNEARLEDMRSWIAAEFMYGIFSHEMGHEVGLRHNFAATTDPLNFRSQYWQMRTLNGQLNSIVNPCPDNPSPTQPAKPECVGPRWKNPVSKYEQDNMLERYSHSTVMDYPGDATQDMNGPGPYDYAAMRLIYGGVVDVWADYSLDGNNALMGLESIGFLDGFSNVRFFPSFVPHHYTDYPNLWTILRDCQNTSPDDPDGVPSPDGSTYTTCKGAKLDFVDYRDMVSYAKYGEDTAALYPWTVVPAALDPQSRPRHGYAFGSDEYADINVPVLRHDNGADAWEQMQFLLSQYNNRYVWDYFRRNRQTFDPSSAVSRVRDRYLEKVKMMVKSLSLYATIYGDDMELLTDPGYLGPLGLAAADAFNQFAEMLTRPEPGIYNVCTAADCVSTLDGAYYEVPSNLSGRGNFSIDVIDGRYLHNEYDYVKGGEFWWSDYQKWVGSFYEKADAVEMMAEAFNHFIMNQKEEYVDSRDFNLNFASIYPEQMRRLLAGVFTDDYRTFAPWVVDSSAPVVNPPAAVPQYFDWTTTGDLQRPAGARMLAPLTGWNVQLQSMIYALMYFPTNWSQKWVNLMRIWVPGSAEAIDVPPEQQIRFYMPQGLTYAALRFGTETIDGDTVEKGIGARMVEWANRLAMAAFANTGQNTDGTVQYVYGSDPSYPTVKDAKAEARLVKFIANLDVMRQLMIQFGYGPMGHDEYDPYG